MSDPSQTQITRIAELGCWESEIRIQVLGGGITNQNFVVEDGDRSFVARICEDLRHLGIDRRNEALCQKAAHDADIAPAVVHREGGILVSEFIESTTADADTVRQPDFLERVADCLRRLHDSRDHLRGELLYFSPFQTVQTYAETACALGAKLPPEMDDLLEDARGLSREMSPFVPALCHNDLLPANILDEDDKRLWLIDWEYGGIGNPLFDVASVSSNAGLDKEQEFLLLAKYLGHSPGVEEREVLVLKAISLLREALWSLIQTKASAIEFDYESYARTNLDSYREARAALG